MKIYSAVALIAREGSIRKAADYLTISPSALNRQLLALEGELGVQLFERSATGVRLSTAGEVYHRHFLDQIAGFRRARETVAAMEGLRIGRVRLLISADLAARFAPAEVARFRAEYPGVTVTLRRVGHDRFAAALAVGDADLALIAQPVFQDGAETLASAEAPLVGVVPAPASPAPLRAEDFLEHDLILPPEGAGLRLLIELFFKQRRLAPHVAMETEDLSPPATTSGRASMQVRLRVDIEEEWLTRAGAVIRPLAGAPRARISLARAEGRVLPVAAARLAHQLATRLQALD
ncbi:MAG: LysR substrate-binding domain-containing protein [Paracoccaceae bacterium]